LADLPGVRVIFSNSDRKHMARVLDLLGLADLFEVRITIEDLGFIPKPHWEAYATLVQRLQAIPSRCVYVDDLLENLRMARRWGFRCVWVTHGTSPDRRAEGGIVAISTVLDLPRAIAGL
ncbi:MAG: HAD-IA family hydrolase, partial [Acidobacteria bacterium]|nr:HAD-IA family hydrolase [Acidobacteriota bacterium]MDW7984811.1 HAD-IA family hydrolase [Acidobacteriota bacterium]